MKEKCSTIRLLVYFSEKYWNSRFYTLWIFQHHLGFVFSHFIFTIHKVWKILNSKASFRSYSDSQNSISWTSRTRTLFILLALVMKNIVPNPYEKYIPQLLGGISFFSSPNYCACASFRKYECFTMTMVMHGCACLYIFVHDKFLAHL